MLSFIHLSVGFVFLASLLCSCTADLPAYPLAVRNPYLSGMNRSSPKVSVVAASFPADPIGIAWLPGSQAKNLPTAQAQFWTGTHALGWSILAQVDGKTYTLFGAPNGVTNTIAASQESLTYTSTHTVATLNAGAATFTIDFFSPVSPQNLLRQSLPFSYLTITVQGTSGATPDVQILNSIDDSWTGGQGGLDANYQTTGTTAMFALFSPAQTFYEENNNMAAWGSVVLATSHDGSSTVSYQSDTTGTLHSAFAENGKLSGQNPTYVAGNSVAFAHDLGKVSASTSVTFAVGQYRIHAIDYLGQSQVGYHYSKYGHVLEAVNGFLSDYGAANQESQSLDKQIEQASEAVSSNYSDITSAAMRQIFGAMEVTLPQSNLKADPYVFLKEISTDGNVNTIDVIYPTVTALTVLAPEWIKYLLAPVVDYLAAGRWPEPYVIHDMGTTYPNASGHDNGKSEDILLQVTGSFLIMIYEYQKLTGDKSWAQEHQTLFQGYADYLVDTGIDQAKQQDTVDVIGASFNQTDLAITAAIGLNAYSAIYGQQNYSQKAQEFVTKIYTNGLGTDAPGSSATHFTYNYPGKSSTWGTIFNFFPDALLDLNTFPASAVSMQCDWYAAKQVDGIGIPYASVLDYEENGMWEMWIAAICPGVLQETIINDEWAFLMNGKNNAPFPDRFYVTGNVGAFDTTRARPTLGTTFALLAKKGFVVSWNSAY